MPTVPDVHRRGTRVTQPSAALVTVGTLFFVVDEGVIERANGTTWETYSGSGGGGGSTVRTGAVGIIIDGGAAVITPGIKGFLEIPFSCTIAGVTLLSSDPLVLSGSIVVDIWKAPYGSYPPTVANSIVAAAKPTISGATKSKDTTLTGWNKIVGAGDVLGFKVDSVTSLVRVTLSLAVQA